MNEDLKNGTLVAFTLSAEVQGKGVIRGVATTGVPVLGKSYIVEYSELSIPWDYPCIVAFESQMRPTN
jgi:hypothetical protein